MTRGGEGSGWFRSELREQNRSYIALVGVGRSVIC
jgi:hypothetical protein